MTTDTPNSSNSCVYIEDYSYQALIGRLDVRVIFGAIYVVIFIVALFGNLLVIYGMVRHCVSFQGIRQEYILSLTSADVLIVTTSLPVTSIQTFLREWIFGGFACKVIPVLQGVGVFATSFTMVAIGVDRYRCIVASPVKALKRAASFRYGDDFEKHKHWPITVLIWIFSLMLSLPYGIFLQHNNNHTTGNDSTSGRLICGYFCVESWPGEDYRKAYGFSVCTLQFLVPMLMCSFCYGRVYYRVKQQTLARASHERLSEETKCKIKQRRRRVLLLATLMLAGFLLSWLPMNFLNIMRDFEMLDKMVPRDYFAILFAVGHCMAMSSVFWDPIIYSFCNPQFRELLCISRQDNVRRHNRLPLNPHLNSALDIGPTLNSSMMELTSPHGNGYLQDTSNGYPRGTPRSCRMKCTYKVDDSYKLARKNYEDNVC